MAWSFEARVYLLAALACTVANSASGADVSFSEHTSSGQATYLHADLNSDGREDFVYTQGQTTGGFAVVLSTGDGTYKAPVSYTLPYDETASAVAIGDFNSDGKADLLVFGVNSSHQCDLFLYLNNGSGAFTEKASFPLDTEVTSVAVGDFNHDGIMDVAFIEGADLNVWFGNGNSGFKLGPTTPVDNEGNLMLGDFDGDGYADLAIGDPVNYDTVQVLYGDGAGSFPSQLTIQVPGGHSVFAATDVNGDGKMDIVASTFYPNNPNHVDVYYGDADRTFASHTTIALEHCASDTPALAADMNGDGINDLVVPESDCNDVGEGAHYVGVLTRNANATYNPDQIVYTSPSASLPLLWLDVLRGNADTKPDIAFTQCKTTPCSLIANFETEVLLNTTSGNFHACEAPLAFEGINVCSPIAGSTVASSVPFHVGAAGPVIMRKVEVWIDGKKTVEQLNGFSNYSFLDDTLTLGQGTHQVSIYAAGWDNSLQEKSFSLYVR
jgi:hypothetical protein